VGNRVVSWESPPCDLSLPTKEIHVWRAILDLPISSVLEPYQTLSVDEKIRADRFRFERDKNRFIVRLGILRTILGYYMAVKPGEVQFCYGCRGKPRLQDGVGKTGIQFNVSHSEGLALYAFCQDHEVGIDIERIREIPEVKHIVQQFFSVRERIAFGALPNRKKRGAFFNCWTRKEAFIKAIGEGLYQPLDTFDVSLTPGEPARLLRIDGNSEMASRWFIKDLKPAGGFVAALAGEEKGPEIRCWQWINGSASLPQGAADSGDK
jgi:4'-phosphopantetheinyl transferase